MKKYLIPLMLILTLPLLGSYSTNKEFLATAINVTAGDTAVVVTDFDTHKVNIGNASPVAMTVIFTRAAGSASTVNVVLQVSYNAGSSWAWYDVTLEVATNTTAITGTTVRKTFQVNAYGVSHFKLYSVENSDSSNNITAFQLVVSY